MEILLLAVPTIHVSGFLLFLVVVPMLIGAIPFITGLALICGRPVGNARQNLNVNTELAFGILLIIVGTSIANIPLACDVIDFAGTAQAILSDKDHLDFYNEYVKTDISVDATEASAAKSGFDYNGVHYSRVNGMRVKLHDPYRKEAAANLADEKKTIFRYDNQSDCDLLCLAYSVYCPDEQLEALDDYFRNDKLTYVCCRNKNNAKSVKISISDRRFYSICDMDPSIVEVCSGDSIQSQYFWDDPEAGYTITQISGDKELTRSFCVVISYKDEVYIRSISTLSGGDTSETYYRVIEEPVSRYFLDLNEEIQSY